MNTQLKNNFSTSDKAKYSFLFDYSFSFKDGEEINLGHWVSYMRTRYRQGLLSKQRVSLLESVSSWTWGPIRPGPKSKDFVVQRNEKIISAYLKGQSPSVLAREYGLSRQWIYQIIKEENE